MFCIWDYGFCDGHFCMWHNIRIQSDNDVDLVDVDVDDDDGYDSDDNDDDVVDDDDSNDETAGCGGRGRTHCQPSNVTRLQERGS